MSSPEPARSAMLSIGALAERTGKRPSAIRYYEQIGLLPQPERVNGRRRYDSTGVRALAVIDTARHAGLTLAEIKELVTASPYDKSSIDRLRDLAYLKLPQVTALLERTELVRSWLASAAQCECPNLSECPLFDEPPR